jgi:hypothetical protein
MAYTPLAFKITIESLCPTGQSPKRVEVRTRNAAGGRGKTSLRNAIKYVDRGQARWLSTNPLQIQFIDSDHRHQSALRTAGRPIYTDGTGYHALPGVKHLPVAGDPLVLFVKNTGGRRAQAGRNGPVRVIMQDGVPAGVSAEA